MTNLRKIPKYLKSGLICMSTSTEVWTILRAWTLDYALLSQIEEELAIDFIFRQFSGLVVTV